MSWHRFANTYIASLAVTTLNWVAVSINMNQIRGVGFRTHLFGQLFGSHGLGDDADVLHLVVVARAIGGLLIVAVLGVVQALPLLLVLAHGGVNKFKVFLEPVHKWRVVKILSIYCSHCHANSLSWTATIGREERDEKNN